MSKKTGLLVLCLLLAANVFMWWSPLLAAKKDDLSQLDLLVDIRHEIVHDYVEDADSWKLVEAAARGMISALDDPYTNYIAEDELAGFDKQVRGTFSGIGAEVDVQQDYLRIVAPLEDSPAWKAGIVSGDTVLEIDGVTTKGLTVNECIKRLVGEPGTKVRLKIRHKSGEEVPLEIVRAQINVRTVRGWRRLDDGKWDFMLDPANKVGYLRLTQFTDTTFPQVKEALDGLLKQEVKGIILDVRFNPGGLLTSAVQLCNLFLEPGAKIVSTKGRTSPEKVYTSDAGDKFPKGVHLALLANEFSASASEILAGGLADNARGKLIGTRTFGKGSVQQIKMLEGGGGAIKITNAYYYLPSGRNIHRKTGATLWGVDPGDGYFTPMTSEEIRKMVDLRRGEAQGTAAPTGTMSPEFLRKDLADPQLAAGLKAILGRIKDGAWPVVGLTSAQANGAAARRESLQKQRDVAQKHLDDLDRELALVDKQAAAGGAGDFKKPSGKPDEAKQDDVKKDESKELKDDLKKEPEKKDDAKPAPDAKSPAKDGAWRPVEPARLTG